MKTFAEVLTDAVRHFADVGYRSPDELERWLAELRAAAEREAISDERLTEELRRTLGSVYERLVDRGGLMARHPTVSRFGFERLKPALRDELNRRVVASANLIRLNREATIATTLRRFSGWATSVPPGGDPDVRRNPVKSDVRRALASMPYEVRRVSIDQGTKFARALDETVARDGAGAIAVVWRHVPERASYQSRPEHVALDGKVFALRGNWALKRGLMKPGSAGYYEDTDRFGVLPYCSCSGKWIVALSRLPDDMLTQRGREELERVRFAA